MDRYIDYETWSVREVGVKKEYLDFISFFFSFPAGCGLRMRCPEKRHLKRKKRSRGGGEGHEKCHDGCILSLTSFRRDGEGSRRLFFLPEEIPSRIKLSPESKCHKSLYSRLAPFFFFFCFFSFVGFYIQGC